MLSKRKLMIDHQIKARGINNKSVLSAFLEVPRHKFISNLEEAYEDYPLPIGSGQTISQPYIVALMTQELELTRKNKVLEIGTGCGYQTAILSKLAGKVYSTEIVTELYMLSKKNLTEYGNVMLFNSDGKIGLKEYSPFDRIIITAAAKEVPTVLFDQLKEGGIMIIPVQYQYFQKLMKINKVSGEMVEKHLCDVMFVPLV